MFINNKYIYDITYSFHVYLFCFLCIFIYFIQCFMVLLYMHFLVYPKQFSGLHANPLARSLWLEKSVLASKNFKLEESG